MYTYVHVQILMILCSVAPGFLRLLPICTRQTLVAQHSSSWHKAFVSPEARSCPVCRTPFAHPGETAPGSRRRRRHHSPAHARQQGSVLSAPGSGSPLFYINSWAMIWPVDYKKGGFWEMSIKQSFLQKQNVHCNSVSRSCAAEFTVIL